MADARTDLTRAICEVTDAWDEPLDEVHDVPQIVNAVMAYLALSSDAAPQDEAEHGPWDKSQQRYEDGCKSGTTHPAAPQAAGVTREAVAWAARSQGWLSKVTMQEAAAFLAALGIPVADAPAAPSDWCGQCGHLLDFPACGPTHALLAHQQGITPRTFAEQEARP